MRLCTSLCFRFWHEPPVTASFFWDELFFPCQVSLIKLLKRARSSFWSATTSTTYTALTSNVNDAVHLENLCELQTSGADHIERSKALVSLAWYRCESCPTSSRQCVSAEGGTEAFQYSHRGRDPNQAWVKPPLLPGVAARRSGMLQGQLSSLGHAIKQRAASAPRGCPRRATCEPGQTSLPSLGVTGSGSARQNP